MAGQNFWFRLTTSSMQCLRLSAFFIGIVNFQVVNYMHLVTAFFVCRYNDACKV